MFRGKKWNLVVFGSLGLACVLALFSCVLRTDPPAEEARPTILKGHQFPVQALAFGPDGATLTSAACYLEAQGLEVAVWDTGTRQATTLLTESPGSVLAVRFHPGGGVLAATVQDRSPLLWNVKPWRERRHLEGHESPGYAVAFSDDSSLLATPDFQNEVMLWDLSCARLRGRCTGHTGRVVALTFAPGGALLASGGWDHTVRLWDVATGEERGVLHGHTSPVQAVAFSPDGHLLVSGDQHGVARLWDVHSQGERATLQTSQEDGSRQEAAALAFSPDGKSLAVAVGRAVQLWDVGTAEMLAQLLGHEGKVKCLAYSPDGTHLASGGHDRTVRLWDMTRGWPVQR